MCMYVYMNEKGLRKEQGREGGREVGREGREVGREGGREGWGIENRQAESWVWREYGVPMAAVYEWKRSG